MKYLLLLFIFCFIFCAPSFAANSEPPTRPGYTISEIEKGSVFEKLGLKNGDEIITVNGAKPSGVKSIIRALEKMQKNRGPQKVKIKRNGKLEELVYTFK